jgi:hypothetical protein
VRPLHASERRLCTSPPCTLTTPTTTTRVAVIECATSQIQPRGEQQPPKLEPPLPCVASSTIAAVPPRSGKKANERLPVFAPSVSLADPCACSQRVFHRPRPPMPAEGFWRQRDDANKPHLGTESKGGGIEGRPQLCFVRSLCVCGANTPTWAPEARGVDIEGFFLCFRTRPVAAPRARGDERVEHGSVRLHLQEGFHTGSLNIQQGFEKGGVHPTGGPAPWLPWTQTRPTRRDSRPHDRTRLTRRTW